ncbi:MULTISPECIES: GAF domain-containing protein [unclassified Variovorax]|uniref:GAF domain-containing protein n=1 Tax=unclassified Variovorax TaxID=663243 RepID=UPI002577ADA8|nr:MULTISPECIES: GAF domain-containing protein [unclassified Variovorax]MDM0086526.1 GAF domain-containing protein [Variovorax sp. J22G40]MDM0145217.1 GAF domain-containing protein [Variovorax sp. J2P1-31]
MTHAHRKRLAGLAAGGSDFLHASIAEILRLMRAELAMDIAFVTQYLDDQIHFQWVDADAPFDQIQGRIQTPLESFCQRVLDGRLPALIPSMPALAQTHDLPVSPVPIGAYMAVPVLLKTGQLYGTLCCLSFEPKPSLHPTALKRLEMSARQVARLIDQEIGWGPVAR